MADFFFFQAEDGIRDDLVTGVQTCALPISSVSPSQWLDLGDARGHWEGDTLVVETTNFTDRSVYRGGGPGPKMKIGRELGRERGEVFGVAVLLKKKKITGMNEPQGIA